MGEPRFEVLTLVQPFRKEYRKVIIDDHLFTINRIMTSLIQSMTIRDIASQYVHPLGRTVIRGHAYTNSSNLTYFCDFAFSFVH